MIDYTPFIIGALFGFGAGFMIAHYIHRLPKLTAARKAAKTRKLNKIKDNVVNRVANKNLNHTIGSAVLYYMDLSPELFVGITTKDLEQLAAEIGEEERNRNKGNHNAS